MFDGDPLDVVCFLVSVTLPETNIIAPENRPLNWKRKFKFLLETTIFRGYVSFRECMWLFKHLLDGP